MDRGRVCRRHARRQKARAGRRGFALLGTRVFRCSPDARWCHGSLLARQRALSNASALPAPPFVTGYVHYPQVPAQN